ncbi:SDR family oxidoreductase [Actinomadura vinacea]|uniref:SDR family oxidoreductase n=1 Tax=Actinomadura vinacea TaxID=115336 RepID=A0ABN3IKP2_9ACTN
MRLTVCGATGGTGVHVVRQALDAGHEVTAVVRDPARLPGDLRDRATVVTADVLDPAAIEPAIKERDAVVSALGPRGRGPSTVCADGIRAISTAAASTGVRRVVLVSASGLAADAGDGPFTRYVVKPLLLERILHGPFEDMRAAEAHLRGTDLDWTIVRPPQLLDKPAKGTYRKAVDLAVRGGLRIPRADLATALLDVLADGRTVGHVISVAT